MFISQSVVSAAVEPDTIVLARNEKDEVIIDSINPGQKSQKIVMTGKQKTYQMFKGKFVLCMFVLENIINFFHSFKRAKSEINQVEHFNFFRLCCNLL